MIPSVEEHEISRPDYLKEIPVDELQARVFSKFDLKQMLEILKYAVKLKNNFHIVKAVEASLEGIIVETPTGTCIKLIRATNFDYATVMHHIIPFFKSFTNGKMILMKSLARVLTSRESLDLVLISYKNMFKLALLDIDDFKTFSKCFPKKEYFFKWALLGQIILRTTETCTQVQIRFLKFEVLSIPENFYWPLAISYGKLQNGFSKPKSTYEKIILTSPLMVDNSLDESQITFCFLKPLDQVLETIEIVKLGLFGLEDIYKNINEIDDVYLFNVIRKLPKLKDLVLNLYDIGMYVPLNGIHKTWNEQHSEKNHEILFHHKDFLELLSNGVDNIEILALYGFQVTPVIRHEFFKNPNLKKILTSNNVWKKPENGRKRKSLTPALLENKNKIIKLVY